MKGYLIDTHVWYWLLFGDAALKPRHLATLTEWQSQGRLYLSAISAWEAAQKQESGRLKLAGTVEDWLENSVGTGDLRLIDLTIPVLLEANRLPGSMHGDPADRILAATCRVEDLTIVTHDTRLLRYGNLGHLRVHAV